MRSYHVLLLPIAASLMLASCGRSATGQVVAVVNGEEVSLTELNAELKSLGEISGNRETIRAAALQSLIDRKLLVQAARERGIDKDPDFLQQQRRANDQLMVGMLAQQVTKNVPVPSQTDIARYLRDNPRAFAQRTIFDLDQVQFSEPSDAKFLKLLEPTRTLSDVVALLNRAQIRFAPQKGALDTATTPKALLNQITKLSAGEPFIIRSGGVVVVSVITGQRTAPLAEAEARRLAAETLRRDAIASIAQKQVKDARGRAKIDYQQGFKPAT